MWTEEYGPNSNYVSWQIYAKDLEKRLEGANYNVEHLAQELAYCNQTIKNTVEANTGLQKALQQTERERYTALEESMHLDQFLHDAKVANEKLKKENAELQETAKRAFTHVLALQNAEREKDGHIRFLEHELARVREQYTLVLADMEQQKNRLSESDTSKEARIHVLMSRIYDLERQVRELKAQIPVYPTYPYPSCPPYIYVGDPPPNTTYKITYANNTGKKE